MKRQLLLVLSAFCSIAYALFALVGDGGAVKEVPKADTQDYALAESLMKSIKTDGLSTFEEQLLKSSSIPWKNEIFQSEFQVEERGAEKVVEHGSVAFAYEGWLKLGDTFYVIINGKEYAVGESLDAQDLFIAAADPRSVSLKSHDGREEVNILYKEKEHAE
jgi:hypothetical protein